MNSRGSRNCQYFMHCRLHDFPRIRAGSDLAVLGATQRGDGVQRAIPNQLGPEFALDIFRNPARDASARKKCRNVFRPLALWPDDQIAAAHMLHASRFRHRSRDVHDRGERINRSRRANLLNIVHAILHAQNKSAGSKQWSQRTRGRCVVCRLHTEKNNLRAAHRAEFRGRFDSHAFLKL